MPFVSLGLSEAISKYAQEKKYKKPTDVQAKVIPALMKGESVLAVAQTGTGKTLSYALPIFDLLKEVEKTQGQVYDKGAPRALILSPTRELSSQLFHVLKEISHHQKLKVRNLTGGVSSTRTSSLSRQEYDILVATPSRVVSGIKNKEISLQDLRLLILDEADQLLELGFDKDIESIMQGVKGDYQIGLFTATMPQLVEEFVLEKMKKQDLKKLSFGDAHQIQRTIETFNSYINEKQKPLVLLDFLKKKVKGRGLIFFNRKEDATEFYTKLMNDLPTLKAKLLHGDLSPADRSKALKSFTAMKTQILVTTDIAARGMDFEDLEWIVNYSLPRTAMYYLHRCGRVGRMGKVGVVYNLIGEYDYKTIGLINDAIQKQSHLKMKALTSKTQSAESKKKVVKKKVVAKKFEAKPVFKKRTSSKITKRR